MNRIFTLLLWCVVSLGLAVFSAWLISAHFAPRPFASTFWPCLICTVLANVLFFTFNVLEGAVVCLICLLVAAGAIPIGARLGAPSLGYVALAACIAGFVSSRIIHTRFFT